MKKSKILALLLAVALMATMFAACGGNDAPAETPEEEPTESAPDTEDSTEDQAGASALDAIKEKGVLVLATEATFPPYEYMKGPDVVGIDIDVAEEIAKALGVELKVENMYFDGLIPALENGQVDFVAAGMSVTDERKEKVDFSVEYASSVQVVLTTPDSGISSLDDLDGKQIGVQMGTISDIILSEDYPDVERIQGKRYTDLAMDLANGKIDGIILDSLPAQALQASDESFIILDDEFDNDSYAIAVQKGNEDLLAEINAVLEQLMADGKIEEYTTDHLS